MKYQFCYHCDIRYETEDGAMWKNECPKCGGDMVDCWDLVRHHIEELDGLCEDCNNRFKCFTI